MAHGTDQAIVGLGDGSVIGTGGNVADADNRLTTLAEAAFAEATQAELDAHAAADLATSVHSLPKVTLANGTAAATDVTVTGMVAADTLISVLSFATAASIATVADRTAEYACQAGGLDKTAGTDETGNQLVIFWLDNG